MLGLISSDGGGFVSTFQAKEVAACESTGSSSFDIDLESRNFIWDTYRVDVITRSLNARSVATYCALKEMFEGIPCDRRSLPIDPVPGVDLANPPEDLPPL